MTARRDMPLFAWGDGAAARDAASARLRQRRRIVVTLLGLSAVASPAVLRPSARFVWNATPSSPTGLYVVTPGHGARRGDMVIAWLPDPARRLADARRYVPAGVPVVKSVAAVTGDTVCAAGDGLRINGRSAARRLTQDARGRALPRWGGCRALEEDQILLLAPRPDSFDGRYFGPSSRRQLIGTARLIWSW